ncbi:TetR/AcrR family transcriptional regulator [Microbacterium pumilum]|uniref:TetR/AcrR family transcriptional regulator n=1 Tax=Microbacterium pumilum TaxID=344165 RepID=A0ABP5EE70_9MICO
MAVRSEQSHRAILEATMMLLDERQPEALTVQRLSIERIAKEAGVSKTTIYRWWQSKAALIIDTFLDNHVARTPVREDIPALDALREHLGSLAEIYSGREGRLVAQLIAECQYDALTMNEFKERFWLPRSHAVNSLIERAMDEGTVRSDLAPEIIAELLYAPLYFRLLFQIDPLDRDIASRFLTAGLEGIATRAAH